jgi:hypothetical protein
MPGTVCSLNITSKEVIEQLYELFILRGIPEHIRSDKEVVQSNR